MSTWAEVAAADPDLARSGADLIAAQLPEALRRDGSFTGYAFLATIRKDGGPRLHPLCPVMAGGRLYVSTVPTSPKLHDLRRDGRYVLHAFLGAGDAEFSVRGGAHEVEDPAVRAALKDAARGWAPVHEHIFELDIQRADAATWVNAGTPDIRASRRRWESAAPIGSARVESGGGASGAHGTWAGLQAGAPELAVAGAELIRAQTPEAIWRDDRFTGYAFVATVRRDGGPRLHPVCPLMTGGELYVAIDPTSAKLGDLRRDGRYILHAFLGAGDAEFSVRGTAREVDDPAVREQVRGAGEGFLDIREEEVLFALGIARADRTTWESLGGEGTRPIRSTWRPTPPGAP